MGSSRFLSQATEGRLAMIRSLTSLAATQSDISSALALAATPKLTDRWRVPLLDGLADGLARRKEKVAVDAGIRGSGINLIRRHPLP
jgi:hypothetical protein